MSKGLIMDKIWFTSDTHFGSERTLELSKRPFDNTRQMDAALILNWNSVVDNEDTVYHLGDFGNADIISNLNGKRIFVIPGNNDDYDILDRLREDKRVFFIRNNYILKKSCTGISFDLQLVHEPEFGAGDGNFFLFGHIHQLQMIKENGLNVGTDCHRFFPIDTATILFYHNAILNHYDKNVFMGRIG